jgi:ABC-2 type transport system permease protein
VSPMRLSRPAAIVLRHLYLVRGSPARVVPLFAWAAVDIVLWGFITRYLNQVTSSGIDFVPTLLGAVLLWDFFTRVMQGVTTAFFEDVWSRNFLNLFATPLSIAEYVIGLVLSTVLTSAIGFVVMIALATAAFGLSFLAYGAAVVPFLLVLFLFGVALGVFGTALVLRLGPASEWLIWPIPAVLSPFAGVFYPLSTLPAWMRWIGRALPPSYVFEGMRSIVRGGPVSHVALAAGLALALGYVVLAGAFFSAVFRHAVRTGLIARYSAETVS